MDILVQGTLLIGLMSLLELLPERREIVGGAFAGWLGFFLLYEPVLVSWRGGTLGHALARLRVVDLATGGNPGATSAFTRSWLKATSGPAGVLFMVLTRRPQALHDLAAGTYVGEREILNEGSRDG